MTEPRAKEPLELDGKYEIRPYAEGGMAIIYDAVELASGRRVALKMLNEKYRDTPEYRKRFSIEARTAAKLHHPNHVTVYSVERDVDGEVKYYTMEFLDGIDLHKEIARVQKMEWPLAVEITRQICDALHELDRNQIVHRDIKPGNCFLVPNPRAKPGECPYTLKLLDLGICKLNSLEFTDSTRLVTQEGFIIGTALFIAPEIFRGDKPSHAVDIYALGVLLYRLITGDYPIKDGDNFEERVITQRPPSPSQFEVKRPLPERLEALMLRALAKYPDDRPRCAAEFGRELGECLKLAGREPNARVRKSLFYATAALSYACFAGALVLLGGLVWPASNALSKTERLPVDETTTSGGEQPEGESEGAIQTTMPPIVEVSGSTGPEESGSTGPRVSGSTGPEEATESSGESDGGTTREDNTEAIRRKLKRARSEVSEQCGQAGGLFAPVGLTVKVTVKVAPSGKATAMPEKAIGTGRCVAKIVEGIRFGRTREGGTVDYEFKL